MKQPFFTSGDCEQIVSLIHCKEFAAAIEYVEVKVAPLLEENARLKADRQDLVDTVAQDSVRYAALREENKELRSALERAIKGQTISCVACTGADCGLCPGCEGHVRASLVTISLGEPPKTTSISEILNEIASLKALLSRAREILDTSCWNWETEIACQCCLNNEAIRMEIQSLFKEIDQALGENLKEKSK